MRASLFSSRARGRWPMIRRGAMSITKRFRMSLAAFLVLLAAEKLLSLLEDHPGSAKYNVEIKDSQVGSVGDHARVEMNFGTDVKKK